MGELTEWERRHRGCCIEGPLRMMTIRAMVTATVAVVWVISMFSPWPRWRQTDGRDGHQPQEGHSLLSRPSKEWGCQWQQGGWRHSECFYFFFLQTLLPHHAQPTVVFLIACRNVARSGTSVKSILLFNCPSDTTRGNIFLYICRYKIKYRNCI